MSQISLAVLAAFLMSCAAFGQPSPRNPQAGLESVKQNVGAAERKLLDAIYRLDIATVDRSESNDLTIITRGAVVTKQEQITALRRRQADAATNQPSASYELTNQKISIYGSIAVVTDIVSVTTSDENPVTMPGRYWQTEIWRNEGGTWKLIHLHASPIPRHK
jgi:ketosteroid isomerase-like protein